MAFALVLFGLTIPPYQQANATDEAYLWTFVDEHSGRGGNIRVTLELQEDGQATSAFDGKYRAASAFSDLEAIEFEDGEFTGEFKSGETLTIADVPAHIDVMVMAFAERTPAGWKDIPLSGEPFKATTQLMSDIHEASCPNDITNDDGEAAISFVPLAPNDENEAAGAGEEGSGTFDGCGVDCDGYYEALGATAVMLDPQGRDITSDLVNENQMSQRFAFEVKFDQAYALTSDSWEHDPTWEPYSSVEVGSGTDENCKEAKTDASGDVSFGSWRLKDVGTDFSHIVRYDFIISETPGEEPGVTYDQTRYRVEVIVGQSSADAPCDVQNRRVVKIAADGTETHVYSGMNATSDYCVFTNEYDRSAIATLKLPATKVLTDKEGGDLGQTQCHFGSEALDTGKTEGFYSQASKVEFTGGTHGTPGVPTVDSQAFVLGPWTFTETTEAGEYYKILTKETSAYSRTHSWGLDKRQLEVWVTVTERNDALEAEIYQAWWVDPQGNRSAADLNDITFYNTAMRPSSASIQGTKTFLDENDNPVDDDYYGNQLDDLHFTFYVVPAEDYGSRVSGYPVYDSENDDEYEVIARGPTSGGTIDFDDWTFVGEAGEQFTFFIYEKESYDPLIKTDSKWVMLVVTLTGEPGGEGKVTDDSFAYYDIAGGHDCVYDSKTGKVRDDIMDVAAPASGISFVNRKIEPRPHSLTLEKEMGGWTSADPTDDFSFTLEVEEMDYASWDSWNPADHYVHSGDKQVTFTEVDTDYSGQHKWTFALKGGESITFNDIPFGSYCSIIEDESALPAGWQMTSEEPAADYLLDDRTIIITNEYSPGPDDRFLALDKTAAGKLGDRSGSDPAGFRLALNNQVTGMLGDRTKGFKFSVTVSRAPSGTVITDGNGVEYVADASGSATINTTLVHGDSFTLSGLPANSRVKITEDTSSAVGYATAYAGSASGSGLTTGDITVSDNLVITFTNARDASVPTEVRVRGIEVGILLVILAAAIMYMRQQRRKDSEG